MKNFSWSITWLNRFETCPLQYKFARDKVPTPPNKYLEKGIAVHKIAEQFVKKQIPAKMPKELLKFGDSFKMARAHKKAHAEIELAFTRKWEPTGWFDGNVWLRSKLDLALLEDGFVDGVDYKTGRVKDYPDQKRLYEVAMLSWFPEFPKVRMQFWFLEHGLVTPLKLQTVSRKIVLAGSRAEFELRAGRMEKSKKFEARPGKHCTWCDYSKAKGGPCKF